MSEDGKELSPEEKLWAVKEYLSGKGLGVDKVNTQQIPIRYPINKSIHG